MVVRRSKRSKHQIFLWVGIVMVLLVLAALHRRGNDTKNRTGNTDAPKPLQPVLVDEVSEEDHTKEGPPREFAINVSLQFGNTNGRHNNQLKAVAHAVRFATDLQSASRTSLRRDDTGVTSFNTRLVVPPFKQSGSWYEFDDLYSMSTLQKSHDSAGAQIKLVAETEEQLLMPSSSDSSDQVAVLCFPRHGIKSDVPRAFILPSGQKKACTDSVQLTSRNVGDVVSAMRAAVFAAAATRRKPNSAGVTVVVYMYEATYYDGVIFHAKPFWQGLRPSVRVKAMVESTKSKLLSVFGSCLEDGDEPSYAAVHVRSLEGSCLDRLKSMERKGKMVSNATSKATDFNWQCRMAADPAAMFKHVRTHCKHRDDDVDHGIFLAGDDFKALLKIFTYVKDSARHELEHTVVSPSRPHLFGVLTDFWVMTSATTFVGNIASTLSRNVCLWRQANGIEWNDALMDCAGFRQLDPMKN